MIEFIFWACLGLLGYTYLGYPLLIILLSQVIRRKVRKSDIEPFVSIIITAYNEEKNLEEKLKNTLSLDYPKEKMEILVASDGSTDKTDEIAKRYCNKGIKLLHVQGRVGKTETQNQAVTHATGEIIIFSDAASIYDNEAIRKIVRNFSDPEVGGVAGKCQYISPENETETSIPTRLYWGLEGVIKESQTRLGTITGASGLIYAVRKTNYVPLSPSILSDMVEPMMVVKQKKRFVYEPEAIAFEETTKAFNQEFRMRVRVISRGMNGMIYARAILNPFRHGREAFQVISHKVLRWLLPFYLLGILITNSFLLHTWAYKLFFSIQVSVYLCTVLSLFLNKNRKNIIFNILYYFFVMASASFVAFFKVLAGNNVTTWETER